ncbi:MAG: AIR synthase-related protein, partial [Candidatus Krumholzibacteria bacterium]|nr:AIR synthase-related protein [Candidatus Krumholzibacteria bacterium]
TACRNIRVLHDSDQGIPVVSGNVSFYNQSGGGRPIAPTPIVSCAGRIGDASVARSMGFKAAGSKVVLLGSLHQCIGGSEYAARFFSSESLDPPLPDFEQESAMVRTLVDAFANRMVLAAHDISHGGLLVTLAEMMMMSAPFDLGCIIGLENLPHGRQVSPYLFSEYGGIVVEIDPAHWSRFRRELDDAGVHWLELGETSDSQELMVRLRGETIEVPLVDLRAANQSRAKLNPLFGKEQ